MKRKVLNILVIIFTIGVIYEAYNYVKEVNISNDNKVLENIEISDNLKKVKQIAIKQQKTDFTWEDIGTSVSAWPDINTFEYYGSECTDATGNNITPTTDVIQFDMSTWKATISTNKTIYCTLSFARRSTVLKLMQKRTTSDYLKTVADNDELLRYVGTYSDVKNGNIKNYICFGTDNKDTCLSDKGKYMYRIIGITTDKVNTNLGLEPNQLKIIKAVPNSDGKTIPFHSDPRRNTKWDSVTIQTEYLNSTNKFLGTIKGMVGTHNWLDLISSPQWYIADNDNVKRGEDFKDTIEKDTTTLSMNYKIGLMYASDYHNSFNYSNDNKTTNSWLHILNGISESSSIYNDVDEWTMTRWGYDDQLMDDEWYVNRQGTLQLGGYIGWGFDEPAARPVFYLTRDISISGEGTESNPFIISDRIIEE